MYNLTRRGRDSSVGIATRYGLGRSGDGIPVGARFSSPVQTGPGAHLTSYTMGTESFLRVKRPTTHPPPSSAEVEGRVELYICSPSCPVLGRTLHFTFTFDRGLQLHTYRSTVGHQVAQVFPLFFFLLRFIV